jgi:metal-responsive CopG/Arc/MetJ family transcriptional regulator
MSRMQRTQIYLEPEISAALDRLARQRGTTRAALLRLAARRLLGAEETPECDPILGIIGLGNNDEATDVSERHDDYLIAAEMASWTR